MWPELAMGVPQRQGPATPPNADPSTQQRRAVQEAATLQLPQPRIQPSYVLFALALS